MDRRLLADHPVVPTLLVGLALGVAASVLVAAAVPAENPSHAGGHLAMALPFAFVAVAAGRRWPPPRPNRLGGATRRSLVSGCWLVVAGMTAEAIGALGYDASGAHAVPVLATVHNGSWPLGVLGLLLILCGAVLAVGSRLATSPASGP